MIKMQSISVPRNSATLHHSLPSPSHASSNFATRNQNASFHPKSVIKSKLYAQRPTLDTEVPRLDANLDDELSRRPLSLDPAGYFIIYIDRDANKIVANYYTNTINKNGLACDPETGEVIPCTPGYVRPPTRTYSGRTAKEISVKILETDTAGSCTHLEHANYLGREFQRAEFALITGQDYIQD